MIIRIKNIFKNKLKPIIDICYSMSTGANLGGAKGASAPPSKFFYLYVTATINSIKISFNDV